MAKMKLYSTVDELIEHIKAEDISYRNLHVPIFIRSKDRNSGKEDIYKIPYKSVLREYMPELEESVVVMNFGEYEKNKYRYKPKMLSNDLYGTPELWSALLELNHLLSLIDFNLEKPIKVFSPKEFKTLLNEIMILEKILV